MVPVYSGDRVLFAGNSITAQGYPTVSGGLGDLITASLVPYTATYTATVSGAIAKVTGATATIGPVQVPRGAFPHGSITILNSGVPGQTSANMAAAVGTQITSYAPDVVVILIGINDASAAVDPVTYGANVQSIVSQTRAWSSTVPIGLVSVLTFTDLWDANGPGGTLEFQNDIEQTLLIPYNQQLASIAAGNSGVTYIPARDALLLWESINNAPSPGVTPVLFNERHPVIPAGQIQLGIAMAPYFRAMP